jgi:cyclic pyranopterin phosphate synthase
MSEPRLSHLDAEGRARMVDVGAKEETERSARARARLRMSPATARAVRDGSGPKGEVLGVARLAGVQAAKQTAQLIPLAHPLPLTFADVQARVQEAEGIVELIAEARTTARTGVEMEAMTACAVAALTVYDMVKAVERGVTIEEVVLLEKHGGRSDYMLEPSGPADATAGPEQPSPRAAALTISTSKAAGAGPDESGPELIRLVERIGLELAGSEVIPDERELIEERLRHWADRERCALILTSGGTGLAPGDHTPEATAAVLEREAPGLAEAIRSASSEHTPNWMLSRARAGVRGRTLIVNLPGSPASIIQLAGLLDGPLRHALALLAGGDGGHPPASGG